jgi:hypothetical protein
VIDFRLTRSLLRFIAVLAIGLTAAGSVIGGTAEVAGATCSQTSNWPCRGGDPGGHVLKTLRQDVYAAARVNGDRIAHRSYDSFWTVGESCGFGPDGWSKTMAMAVFATSLRRSVLTRGIQRSLGHEGWMPGPVTNAGQKEVVAQWIRALHGQVATIQLFRVTSANGVVDTMTGSRAVRRGQSGWALAASWQPRPAGSQCP